MSSLQALPWRATLSKKPNAITSCQTTVSGTRAISEILAAVLAADQSACEAVLQDGSWDAAVRRIRCTLRAWDTVLWLHCCLSAQRRLRVGADIAVATML